MHDFPWRYFKLDLDLENSNLQRAQASEKKAVKNLLAVCHEILAKEDNRKLASAVEEVEKYVPHSQKSRW